MSYVINVLRERGSALVLGVSAFALANVVVVTSSGSAWIAAVAVIAVATPLAAMVLRRPQRGVLLFAALIPFDGLRIILPIPNAVASYWVEGLVLAIVLGALLAGREARPIGRPAWLAGLIVLAVTALLSATQVGALQAAVGLKVLLFPALLALAVLRCPLDSRERDSLVTILMVTGAITAVVGLLQQLVGASTLHDLGYRYDANIRFNGTFLRSFSTFVQPFPFAFFVMMVVLVCLPVALANTRRARNQLFLFALPVYALALLSSIVRAGWLGVAVGLVYLGLQRHRALLFAIPVALVLLVSVPNDSTNALSSKTAQERATTWQDNVHVVFDHPFGIGVGASGSAAGKVNELSGGAAGYQQTGVPGDATSNASGDAAAYEPDNFFFKIALELGFVGLWTFVLFLVSAFTSARKAALHLFGPDRDLALGVSAFVLASAVASVFSTYFEIVPATYYFWILLGVVAAVVRDTDARTIVGRPTTRAR